MRATYFQLDSSSSLLRKPHIYGEGWILDGVFQATVRSTCRLYGGARAAVDISRWSMFHIVTAIEMTRLTPDLAYTESKTHWLILSGICFKYQGLFSPSAVQNVILTFRSLTWTRKRDHIPSHITMPFLGKNIQSIHTGHLHDSIGRDINEKQKDILQSIREEQSSNRAV